MLLENQLLSKVLDTKEITELSKYNITAEDFTQQGDSFLFIKKYYREFGEVPAFTTVVAECPTFDYQAEVYDAVGYMCKKLKADNAKRQMFTLLQQDAPARFAKLNGAEFAEWLSDSVSSIKEFATADTYTGSNWAVNGAERKEIYDEGKIDRTYMYIPTPYKSLTTYLGGGFEIGDYILLQSFSNKGKSWLSTDLAVRAWREGFGVIYYALELSKKQQLQRNDTIDGKYRNSSLKTGALTNEQDYYNYLDEFNESNETPFIVKTMEDLPRGLTLDMIEADMKANSNVKLIIIDGFNLMNHRGKDKAHNNMANTSRKLRQILGRNKVAGLVVHQIGGETEKNNKKESEDGVRLPNPADLCQYSGTIAVVQDACTVLNFDQVDGVGKILLAKSRTPYVNKEIDLHCNFDSGYITEADITAEF